MFELNEELVCKVRDTVNAGLVKGLGKPEPGKMCVEAAVCYAMGLPHSDKPTCVGRAVRNYKIRINDAKWSSNEARTAGLLKLAIAQLGSDTIDQRKFVKIVAEQTIRKIVPMALRAAKVQNPKRADKLEAAAANCESKGTEQAARQAKTVATDAYATAAAAQDNVLNVACQIALDALIELKSPGCAFLYLVEG